MPDLENGRRRFLRLSSLGLASLAASPVRGPALDVPLTRRSRPKRVVVAGAGLAGLAAAYELQQAGHEVTVLEARGTAGGRVRTLRAPFADGLYAEAGGQAFYPVEPNYAARYADAFGLEKEPAGRGGSGLFHFGGRTLRPREGAPVEWPVALTAEERRLGLDGMRARYIAPAVAELRRLCTEAGWSADAVERFDGVSFADVLRRAGASPAAVELLRLSDFDFVGEGAEHYSALDMFGQLFNTRAQVATARGRFFAVSGGNDRLPEAFARRLGERIRYGAAVTGIERSDTQVAVRCDTLAGPETVSAEYLVVAIPFSVLRGIEVTPAFSPGKGRAIQTLSHTSLARTYVQCARRFWNDQGLSGDATTDLDTSYFWESTSGQAGPRGILQGYVMGPAARRLTALDPAARVRFAMEQAKAVFLDVVRYAEDVATVHWDEEPWSRGDYAWLRPGEGRSLWPHLATPEGRVHFAGEHTSTWLLHGSMQGALESGIRAARAINEAA